MRHLRDLSVVVDGVLRPLKRKIVLEAEEFSNSYYNQLHTTFRGAAQRLLQQLPQLRETCTAYESQLEASAGG